jgi:hypothetical protein
MSGSGIASAQAAYDNLLASGLRFGVSVHYMVWFAHFYGCGRVFLIFLVVLVRVFPLSILSSPVGDMFWSAASSAVLFPGILRDSEPILTYLCNPYLLGTHSNVILVDA